MAHQQQGAVEFEQQLFQQFECFQIKIVGRFVHHQQVGGLAEQLGENEAVLFTTGQCFHRLAQTIRREQEILQIGNHMFLTAVDLDVVTAFTQVVTHTFVANQFAAQLIEIGQFDLGAYFHCAGIGYQLAQQYFQQGGFAGTIGPDQTDLIATHDFGGKILDDGALTKGLGDVFQLDHNLAAGIRTVELHAGLAFDIATRLELIAHGFECTHPALVAGTAGLDALAYPHFFLSHLLVEFHVGLGFSLQLLVTEHQKTPVIMLPDPQCAAIKFEDAIGNGLQEAAIMGDDHHGAAIVLQLFFQPLDGRDVEMVSGLVQQQHIRVADQRATQGHPPHPAAGQFRHGFLGW